MKQVLGLAFAIGVALSGTGCRVILPAHTQSLDVSGERVHVTILPYEKISAEEKLKSSYEMSLGTLGGRETAAGSGAVGAAALVAPAVNFAVDAAAAYIKKQIDIEKSQYSAQYQGSAATDSFYANQKDAQWYGFELLRLTAKHASVDDPAARVVFGMRLDEDGQKLLVTPIYAKVRSSRAKVLTDQWPTWIWTFPYRVFLSSGSEVKVACSLEFEYLSKDEAGTMKMQKITKDVTLPLFDIDLDKSGVGAYVGSGLQETPAIQIPAPAVPFRNPADGKAGYNGSGTFSVSVKMTESDPSNATELLTMLGDQVDQNKSQVSKLIVEAATGKAPPDTTTPTKGNGTASEPKPGAPTPPDSSSKNPKAKPPKGSDAPPTKAPDAPK